MDDDLVDFYIISGQVSEGLPPLLDPNRVESRKLKLYYSGVDLTIKKLRLGFLQSKRFESSRLAWPSTLQGASFWRREMERTRLGKKLSPVASVQISLWIKAIYEHRYSS